MTREPALPRSRSHDTEAAAASLTGVPSDRMLHRALRRTPFRRSPGHRLHEAAGFVQTWGVDDRKVATVLFADLGGSTELGGIKIPSGPGLCSSASMGPRRGGSQLREERSRLRGRRPVAGRVLGPVAG